MPLIKDIIATETFLKKLAREISSTVETSTATVQDSTEGPQEGSVTHYEVDSGPVCGEPEGEALDWSVTFTGSGTANVGYTTADQEYRDSDISGPFKGTVEITLPASPATAEDAATEAMLNVTIEVATLEEDEPFDDSAIDENA